MIQVSLGLQFVSMRGAGPCRRCNGVTVGNEYCDPNVGAAEL